MNYLNIVLEELVFYLAFKTDGQGNNYKTQFSFGAYCSSWSDRRSKNVQCAMAIALVSYDVCGKSSLLCAVLVSVSVFFYVALTKSTIYSVFIELNIRTPVSYRSRSVCSDPKFIFFFNV